MLLTSELIKKFEVSASFNYLPKKTNELSFSASGAHCITSVDLEQLILYDCDNGNAIHTINSKKYGAGNVLYTNQGSKVLHTSIRIDNFIRYLSLDDNKYLCYFKGHTNKVLHLTMSERGSKFMSSSVDGSVRMWDFRTPYSQGCLNFDSVPISAINKQGSGFAVALDSDVIQLYSMQNFISGPMVRISLKRFSTPSVQWKNIKFSPDGRYILVITDSILYLVDSYKGELVCTYCESTNTNDACFSPDGLFIFCASHDGSIYCWDIDGTFLTKFDTSHNEIQRIAFNPVLMMFVSSSDILVQSFLSFLLF